MPSKAASRSAVSLSIPRSIVLVGLMGAGKSTIGRRLAQSLGREFVDSDQEIADAAGCSISDIFEIHGEEIFRDLEQRVMLRLLDRAPCVIATGGGSFINPRIRNAIKQKAVSVWLRAELGVLIERVSRRDSRPLLKKGDKREILGKLMDERDPIYALADCVVDSSNDAHDSVVRQVIEALANASVLPAVSGEAEEAAES